MKKANRLIRSTSPYLLQHAYNPVDWFEWGEEALAKSREENKPILVSIGYSSCHWCHVMEREVFENDEIARLMNEYLVCIKVDREERPDIDQIYMEAVQAMGMQGGWPLNVFLTPEQKPFYGGTYFPPQQWIKVLQAIHKAFTQNRKEIESSASELAARLRQSDAGMYTGASPTEDLPTLLNRIFEKLASAFDKFWGGLEKAPKFIMPSVWLWLLRYYHITRDKRALDQLLVTLRRICMGGIYDQIRGGFARYSVDHYWFVPHFEKMLYDNAQLMSLYAEAYALTGEERFKTILYETFGWLQEEMTHPAGGFYSALDADSEGEEGKFYVWTKEEIEEVLQQNASPVLDYYNIKAEGNWEHHKNILITTRYEDEFLARHTLTKEQWQQQLQKAKELLLTRRQQRIRPSLDDKIITAWNAMMDVGLTDAYQATGDERFLKAALKNMRFLENELASGTTLYRSFRNSHSHVTGFLDDYAYMIQACLRLYQVTFDEYWLRRASVFTTYTIENFRDDKDGFFYYTGKNSEKLIATKKEMFDNVIPASNSVMAQNLFHLGTLLDNATWVRYAVNMTESLTHLITREPNYMSNWAIVLTEIKKGMAEVAFTGPGAHRLAREFHKTYQPFALTLGTETESTLPLLQGKHPVNGHATVYVCYHKTCRLPVQTVEEAIAQLR